MDGVVLAAGYSKRANSYKMELLLGEKTLVQRSVESFYDICDRIIVVGGYKIDKVVAMLSGYSKVKVVFNKYYEKGMFTSVKEGIRHVESQRFYFTPGDYPFIDKKLCIDMAKVDSDIVIPTFQGKRGHPILLSSNLIKDILKQPDDSNLKKFINNRAYSLLESSNDNIFIDIDTKEDYMEALRRL